MRRRFLEGYLKALEGRAKRNEGRVIDAPAVPTAEELRAELAASGAAPQVTPVRSKTGHTLLDVVDYWKTTGEKSPRTILAAQALVAEFTALHGAVPLIDIGKAHFVALRDKLLGRVKPATVQSRFNLLRAAFTVCLEDDQLGITQNPMQYVKVRNVEDGIEERDAFSVDQLQALFDSDVFMKGERPEGGRGGGSILGSAVGHVHRCPP